MTEIKAVHTCTSLEEALTLLSERPMKILAGGTDIFPLLRADRLGCSELLDIYSLDELRGIRVSGGTLSIGALTTHSEIESSELIKDVVPALSHACFMLGSTQIRNRATIGGNVCNASPAADSVPVLMAANAEAIYKCLRNGKILEKSVPLEEFMLGVRKTALPEDALLTEIRIPLNCEKKIAFDKLGGRNALAISIVSAALAEEGGRFHAVLGSMGPAAVCSARTDELLSGSTPFTIDDIEDALKADLSPISDIRASKEYRLAAAAGMLMGLFEKLKLS